MKKLALLLSLLLLGALGLVACGGDDDDRSAAASETETTTDELAADNTADNKSCGRFGRYRFAVVEGDVSCRAARRVMRANSIPRTMPDSWSCGGSDAKWVCVNEAGEMIKAYVTCNANRLAHGDPNRSRCPGWIKRSVAQRRHGREAKPSRDIAQEARANLSRKQVRELKREANTWARLFSRRGCNNKYMGQPMCERLVCKGIKNCTPVSAAFEKSFADATVEDIKSVRTVHVGWTDHPVSYAAVKFSNGVVVVFNGGGEWYSCAGGGSGCTWSIAEVGQNRRFLQAAAPRE
jgi:hypothetical protein